MAVIAILLMKISGMFVTAIFMPFGRNVLPDTAHDYPILRIGVVYDKTVSEPENL